MEEKKGVPLRQFVREQPEVLETAAADIQLTFIRERLEDYDSVQEAYQAGGLLTGALNSILDETFCQELLAPVQQAYEDEFLNF